MEDPDLQASQISVTYPVGSHTFTRTGEDAWVLDLTGAPELGTLPRVTGYDDAGVLRVLAAFLAPERVPPDGKELRQVDKELLAWLHMVGAGEQPVEAVVPEAVPLGGPQHDGFVTGLSTARAVLARFFPADD